MKSYQWRLRSKASSDLQGNCKRVSHDGVIEPYTTDSKNDFVIYHENLGALEGEEDAMNT